MRKRSSFETLAVPMFVSGILAMLASAFISLGATASATSPVQHKKITLTYLSSGYSANDGGCGSAQDHYSSWNMTSFRAKYSSGNSSNNDKTFLCTATFYVVDDVQIPTPEPVPTVTIIYRPTSQPTPTYSPTTRPTRTPRPTPTPTRTSRPNPTFTPIFTPSPRPTFPIRPTLTPTRAPRH
jgi:hypothetical protein